MELPRNFKDTWTLGPGTRIETAEYWLATGFEYELGEQWRLGANYTYAWLGNNKLDQTLPLVGRIAGDHDGSARIFGLYAVWSL